MAVQVKMISNKKLGCGEGPHWDEKTQSLYFVDIPGCTINKYDSKTGLHTQAKICKINTFNQLLLLVQWHLYYGDSMLRSILKSTLYLKIWLWRFPLVCETIYLSLMMVCARGNPYVPRYVAWKFFCRTRNHWLRSRNRSIDLQKYKNKSNGNLINNFCNSSADQVSVIIPIENEPNKFLIILGCTVATVVWDGVSETVTNFQELHKLDEDADMRTNDGKVSPGGVLFVGKVFVNMVLKCRM